MADQAIQGNPRGVQNHQNTAKITLGLKMSWGRKCLGFGCQNFRADESGGKTCFVAGVSGNKAIVKVLCEEPLVYIL